MGDPVGCTHVCFCICELREILCDGDLSWPGALGLGKWDLFYMSDLSRGEHCAAPEASFIVVDLRTDQDGLLVSGLLCCQAPSGAHDGRGERQRTPSFEIVLPPGPHTQGL